MSSEPPAQSAARIEAPSSFWGLLRDKKWRSAFRRLGNQVANWPPVRFFLSSISARLTALMALATAMMMVILIVSVTSHVSNGIFQKRLNIVLQDASLRTESLQAAFDATVTDSVSGVQDAAYTLMSDQRDASAGAGGVGAMLLRDPNETRPLAINEIIDPEQRSLITPQLRRAVEQKGGVHWQSVSLKNSQAEKTPGIVVGSRVFLPLVGSYEVYMVYSLAYEQQTIYMVNQVLIFGTVVLLAVLTVLMAAVSYSTMAPARRAAKAARKVSAGNLQIQLPVRGSDELAQLSQALNDMASYLREQISDYEELSTLQQRFVSDVSHELRTPLATIRMAADLIYDERDQLSETNARSVTILHRQVDRFDKMLADLIEISRIDASVAQLSLSEVSLASLAAGVLESNRALAESLGVEVRLSTFGDTVAQIDETRVTRITQNLLVNAIEFAEGKPVQITVAGSQTAVALQVRDHGPGMTDAVAQHVFDRFYRADPSRKRTTGGTGLGLAISAEDAALHSGLLTVLSCPQQGSAFTLLLPRQQGEEIADLPEQVENQDLITARSQWAATHPEDILLSEDLEDTSLEVRHLEGGETEQQEIPVSAADSLPQMPAQLPADMKESTVAQPLPHMPASDTVIDIQERIKNLEADEAAQTSKGVKGETR
ncbi:MtrAB system histidine kinase MtrB [Varibaculum cambriense]|uniref:Sensor histidine kinase MtrB n=1 Tax=Varibaculum cambriense TaxID=184870 RepID=A0ABX4UQ36_9ACTO|nr:MtrAB system histidine kinase MtrB [Varibaculum cambriense]MBS5943788.1 HAMP domain-containing histidine kinase [Varibaculum cambriense]MDK8275197.1 MtrAB system histidine kinase MtrB [Varibaculum cambriense]MDU5315769.1 MtrAB system histidine kinase MtrB [Varibaculum cambriense]MDU5614318.1 MtrAB system histidine kinase MtrB [Varibaculum cambriense]MDU6680348.1 MtrAB system histidine kinase MtrB [Varibaculum cambriense]